MFRTLLTPIVLTGAIAALLAPAAQADLGLNLLSNFSANISGTGGGEVIAFDAFTSQLAVTRAQGAVPSDPSVVPAFGINLFNLADPSSPTSAGFVDFTNAFGSSASVASLTSVAIDPLGRGFGVAALVPAIGGTNTGYSVAGLLGFFDLNTGMSLGTLSLNDGTSKGYHPDSIVFSPDGSRIIVTNEGEFTAAATVQRPGSLGVIDISGITLANKSTALAALGTANVVVRDFSGVTPLLAGIRTNLGGTGAGIETAVQAMEPEFLTISGTQAFVTLQENNAVGTFDLVTNQWTAVRSLGTRSYLADTKNDGIIKIDQAVNGMPMPDNISLRTYGATRYLFLASEGDARTDDADKMKGNQFGTAGFPTLDPSVTIPADQLLLEFSRVDGDTDLDGDIDVPTVFGGRGFLVVDADTGAVVYDSANPSNTNYLMVDLSQVIKSRDTLAGFTDSRSPAKGAEPEALTIGDIDGVPYLFVGAERSNHIFMYNIANPLDPVLVDVKRLVGTTAPTRPESFSFVPASENATGTPLLIVGYEGSTSAGERIAVFQVPEPGSVAMLALGGLLVGGMRRRRG